MAMQGLILFLFFQLAPAPDWPPEGTKIGYSLPSAVVTEILKPNEYLITLSWDYVGPIDYFYIDWGTSPTRMLFGMRVPMDTRSIIFAQGVTGTRYYFTIRAFRDWSPSSWWPVPPSMGKPTFRMDK